MNAADIRLKSVSERVKALSDDQITAMLATCSAILNGVYLDMTITGAELVFDAALLATLEWYVANPSGLSSLQEGQLKESYSQTLPPHIMLILNSIRIQTPFAYPEEDEIERGV